MKIRYIIGWVLVRPRRWIFYKMTCASCGTRWMFRKDEIFGGYKLPNVHWWLMYITIFKLCSWLYWDAWGFFCTYEKGFLKHKPLIARVIHKIGGTTAGYAIGGGECFHCAADEGCQVELSQDETGEMFRLERNWHQSTQEGTDYRFCGTTICPKCGHEDYYEDGSL